MGKTIQMLALILTNTKFLWEEKSKPQNATTKENAQKSEENDLVVMESYSSVPVRSTLIVCPLSVLLQWKQEILKHASPKVTVYVFHGSNRFIFHHFPFFDAKDVLISLTTAEKIPNIWPP